MAASFIRVHAGRVDRFPVEQHRARWLERGIPADVIDRVGQFQQRWGGLVLPPAPCYEGGPRALSADTPDGSPENGWSFWAGDQRCSVPFSFVIGTGGEFGIQGLRWIPLHATVEGWIESVALAYRARLHARQVTRFDGAAVNDLDLSGLAPVPLVAGLADTWWCGPDSLVAVYRGEAESFGRPGLLRAHRYDGLPADAFWFAQ